MIGFQALLAIVADMFCRNGGLDRTSVTSAMFNVLEEFRVSAQDIDADTDEELFVFLVDRADGKTVCILGSLGEAMGHASAMQPLRVCFVSLNHAAAAARMNAQRHGRTIDKFGVTSAELADSSAAIADGMRAFAAGERTAPRSSLN